MPASDKTRPPWVPPQPLRSDRARITARAACQAARDHDLASVVVVFPGNPNSSQACVEMVGVNGDVDAATLLRLTRATLRALCDHMMGNIPDPFVPLEGFSVDQMVSFTNKVSTLVRPVMATMARWQEEFGKMPPIDLLLYAGGAPLRLALGRSVMRQSGGD